MSLFSKKTSSEYDDQPAGGSGKSKAPLLVLLLLVGVFAYLYFFTSLIVPHDEPKPAEKVAAPEVKQSMPPKPAAGTPAVATEAKKGEEAKPAVAPATAPAAAPAAKPAAPAPAPAPVAKPAAPAPAAAPAAKPAAPASAPAAVQKTAAPASAPAKKEEAKPAKPAEAKPAPAAAKKESPKSEQPAKTADKQVAKKAGYYVLFAGEFPAGEESAAVEAKFAAAGVKPVIKSEKKKNRIMNRLYFGSYNDYDRYTSELEKLRKSTKGAFGVEKDGTYYLYAGSFSTREKAEKEKKDLSAKGVSLQIQQTDLSLKSVRLTAGSFKSKADADKAAAKLKQAGVKVRVLPKGE